MKKATLFVSALVLGMFVASCGGGTEAKHDDASHEETHAEEAPAGKTGSVTYDAAASEVVWGGSMIGIKAHEGTIALKEAALDLENGAVVGGKFVIDMTTINPTDSAYDEEHTAEMLVGHLGTGDFFAVEEHPTATFEVTSADAEAGTVTGNLTVRGKTNEETVTDVVVEEGKATGKLVFNRQNYDVAYSTGMKDAVISDDIELDITLVEAK
ncbi:MAG: hypothetical protein CL843_10685 [Crocinitomicaceae bacterium]|nr:hypothetical protein [Crocinitomicaceae bacterium]|tara:strand:- start:5129 stop:5764 length:636 start_codon:yes stop_codon:yes gene_type:complete